ncbi:MAG TPA: type I DNA topoisomerase, partial [Candidatus Parcubacteria bacterium]|nr:type I DNA topoisomerase [Candidatus Parcubacteria bacterium]
MRLIIVESPTKCKTIERFLKKDYKVLASYGHIRDLPKGKLGVDVENNFEPTYVIPPKARKNINILKKAAEKSEKIILATDEDREGESIAWHLEKVLQLDNRRHERIAFHEITKSAVEAALKKPLEININLVNAQKTRRILDRIVGYKISPFLWKKITRGLSAGRVQSVALRLITEREREIERFKPEEYWTIEALLQKKEKPEKIFSALLIKKDGKNIPKLGIKTEREGEEIIKDLEKAEYRIISIGKKEIKRNPLPPFTTSTLQQEAWKKLSWPAKLTMKTAQQLYEKGYTSYHRTDSLNLSEQSLKIAEKFIKENFGEKYWPGFPRKFKTKSKGAQEAHEAIRPTRPEKTPEKLKKEKLDEKEFRLYDLIWRRFIACQMKEAIFNSVTVDVSANNYILRSTGQTLKFDGFLKVYPIKFEEKEIPPIEKEEVLKLVKLTKNQHFTKPPSRYTDATLIKTLEENGIGRPSTYAPIISIIQERNYVKRNEQKKFQPTEIGVIVNDLLVKHFPEIVDIKFTAKMEENLDKIAQGEKNWVKVCQDFYKPFKENLENKYKEISKKEFTNIPTEKKCPKCGAPLVIRLSRFGKFYACPN